MMAGQSVGMATSIQSVAEILLELRAQAITALGTRSRIAFAEAV
jgi:hypothetical protein